MSHPGQDGWTFLDASGNPHRRQRNPGEGPIYDLDCFSRADLEAFVGRCRRDRSRNAFARDLYPERPLHFPRAAMTLWRMAVLKLKGGVKSNREFERLYRTLPQYARFREYYNVKACVVPGKKFRKRLRTSSTKLSKSSM